MLLKNFYMYSCLILLTRLKGFLFLLMVLYVSPTSQQPGHLKEFGSHIPPIGNIKELLDFPLPDDFYENYVLDAQPFIVKGGAKQIPAYKLWNDDYLLSKYGDINTLVEVGKKEDRSGNTMTPKMKEFLNIYKQNDIYMVNDVPDEMFQDLIIPKSIQCGGFLKGMQMVLMWFSSGGTKSVLHSDSIDNINCLLDGEKELRMIDKDLQQEVEEHEWIHQKAYSKVDVEKVDMKRFPNFQNIPWYHGFMEKGDCLFIPKGWYHTVWSYGKRNLAVNLWFARLLRLDDESCKDYQFIDNLPLNSKIAFKNKTAVMLSKLEELRSSVFEYFMDKDFITTNDILTSLIESNEISDTKEKLEIISQKFLEICDINRDLTINWEEVYACDVNEIAKLLHINMDMDTDNGYVEKDEL